MARAVSRRRTWSSRWGGPERRTRRIAAAVASRGVSGVPALPGTAPSACGGAGPGRWRAGGAGGGGGGGARPPPPPPGPPPRGGGGPPPGRVPGVADVGVRGSRWLSCRRSRVVSPSGPGWRAWRALRARAVSLRPFFSCGRDFSAGGARGWRRRFRRPACR